MGDDQPVLLAQTVERRQELVAPLCGDERRLGGRGRVPRAASAAARRTSTSRRLAVRRRFRASFATIRQSHGRNGDPRRNRPSARNALTNASCAASWASASFPVTR